MSRTHIHTTSLQFLFPFSTCPFNFKNSMPLYSAPFLPLFVCLFVSLFPFHFSLSCLALLLRSLVPFSPPVCGPILAFPFPCLLIEGENFSTFSPKSNVFLAKKNQRKFENSKTKTT